MWSARKQLLVNAILLLALIVLIRLDIRPPFYEPQTTIVPYRDDEDKAFDESLQSGIEALEYMYDSQLGKAKVAELVEQQAEVQELRKCSGREKPNQFGSRSWSRNGDFHVFSAHLDVRNNSSLFPDSHTVQVIASSFGIDVLNRSDYFCHTRLYHHQDDRAWTGSVVRAHVRWIWQRAWDPRNEFYNAFLISCPISKKFGGLGLVLISRNTFCINSVNGEDKANFTQILQTPAKSLLATGNSVLGLRAEQIKIAVCAKGLAFLDESELSARKLLEWVGLQRVLGADAITVYVYWIPPRVRQVLRWMADSQMLEMIELDLPGTDSPNDPMTRHQFIARNRQQKRRHELIPYNDCFYRHAPSHHFVLIVDTDELVVPLRLANWQQMLHSVLAQGKWRAEPSSLSIRNVFKFWGNASGQQQKEEESLLRHKWRSANVQERDQYGKSFVSTRSVASVFNHFALHRQHQNVSRTLHVGEKDALKLHWRRMCPEAELGAELCEKLRSDLVEDRLLERFETKFNHSMRDILAQLEKLGK